MAKAAFYVQQSFRALAVLGAVAAFLGFLGVVVVAMGAGADAGHPVPFDPGLSDDQMGAIFASSAVGVFGGIILNLLANTVASFVAGFRDPPAPGTAGTDGRTPGGPDGGGRRGAAERPGSKPPEPETEAPTSERWRRRLARTYVYLSAFVGLLLVGALVARSGGAPAGTSALSTVLLFASLGTRILFGGIPGAALALAVFLAVYYGVRRGAREALVANAAVGVLFVLSGVAFLSVSGSAVGILFTGVAMLVYSASAMAATEWQYLDR